MSKDLPPLTALRAFDCAARHKSFAKAADELHVTPAALSFQIKSLEDRLGQPLFHRLNRAVELTELGRTLSPGLSDGFDAIRTAWRSARRQLDESSLTVTAGPAFTAKWLAPRLFSFAQIHPEIELRFIASLRRMDFGRDEIDLAVRFSAEDEPNLDSEPLFDELATPVMAPALVEKYGTLQGLKDAPLLHDHSISGMDLSANWPTWFNLAGLERKGLTGLRFSQADHGIDTALAGGGVILARTTLAAAAMRDGTLVAPFDLALSVHAKYRIVHQKGAETRPQLSAFLSWLRAEAADMATLNARFTVVAP